MLHPTHDWSGFLPLVRVGQVEIQTYLLIISLTLVLSVGWLIRRSARLRLKRNDALDIAIVAMLSGFLGSRLLHVFFEEPRYYWHDPIQILHIERGGFVWFGGLIAGFLGGLIWVQFHKLNLATWLDVFAPILAFGYAMGRGACLLTGCCYGRICELSSGFTFRYPTQAFAVIWELLTLATLLMLEAKSKRDSIRGRSSLRIWPGCLFWSWVLLHSLGRIVMEGFRDDDRGPLLMSLSLSTLLSFLFLSLSLFQFWRQFWHPFSRRKLAQKTAKTIPK